ncbi:MAG: uncharacterized protein A8A55_1881 [Amphiamblys sp. WSBS2006]|nr:MAG: uncharacterized protein A8A55_1881 [Amphiamblys sp. WSBS2006]
MSEALQNKWILAELISEIQYNKGRGESLAGTQRTCRTGQLIVGEKRSTQISDGKNKIDIILSESQLEYLEDKEGLELVEMNGFFVSIDDYVFEELIGKYSIRADKIKLTFKQGIPICEDPVDANEEARKVFMFEEEESTEKYPYRITPNDWTVPSAQETVLARLWLSEEGPM